MAAVNSQSKRTIQLQTQQPSAFETDHDTDTAPLCDFLLFMKLICISQMLSLTIPGIACFELILALSSSRLIRPTWRTKLHNMLVPNWQIFPWDCAIDYATFPLRRCIPSKHPI